MYILVWELEGRVHSGDTSIGEWVILKYISEKWCLKM
jgi:hypothetical protein